jgi:hypothetical protein
MGFRFGFPCLGFMSDDVNNGSEEVGNRVYCHDLKVVHTHPALFY